MVGTLRISSNGVIGSAFFCGRMADTAPGWAESCGSWDGIDVTNEADVAVDSSGAAGMAIPRFVSLNTWGMGILRASARAIVISAAVAKRSAGFLAMLCKM